MSGFRRCQHGDLMMDKKRTQTEQQYCSFFKVWRVEILKKMLSVIISNFHHVVKFTNAVFNFSSVSLSSETSLAAPYTLSFNKENFARFWVKLDLALYSRIFCQFIKLSREESPHQTKTSQHNFKKVYRFRCNKYTCQLLSFWVVNMKINLLRL